MFETSLIVLALIAFLAVITAALILVFTKSENKTSCGCCAGCGIVAAIFLALGLGVGAVLLFTRHDHHGSQLRIEHLDSDEAFDRLEDSMDELERRLERIFDD